MLPSTVQVVLLLQCCFATLALTIGPPPGSIITSDISFALSNENTHVSFRSITITGSATVTIHLCSGCSERTAATLVNVSMTEDATIVVRGANISYADEQNVSLQGGFMESSVLVNSSMALTSIVFWGSFINCSVNVANSHFLRVANKTFPPIEERTACITLLDAWLLNTTMVFSGNVAHVSQESNASGVLFAGSGLWITKSSTMLFLGNNISSNVSSSVLMSGPSTLRIATRSSFCFEENVITASAHTISLGPVGNVSIFSIVDNSSLAFNSNALRSTLLDDYDLNHAHCGITLNPEGDYSSLLEIRGSSSLIALGNALDVISLGISVGPSANRYSAFIVTNESVIIFDNNQISSNDRSLNLEGWIMEYVGLDSRSDFLLSGNSLVSMSGNTLNSYGFVHDIGFWISDYSPIPSQATFIVEGESDIIMSDNFVAPRGPDADTAGIHIYVSCDGSIDAIFTGHSAVAVVGNTLHKSYFTVALFIFSYDQCLLVVREGSTMLIADNHCNASGGMILEAESRNSAANFSVSNSSVLMLRNVFVAPLAQYDTDGLITIRSLGATWGLCTLATSTLFAVEDTLALPLPTSVFIGINADFHMDNSSLFRTRGNEAHQPSPHSSTSHSLLMK